LFFYPSGASYCPQTKRLCPPAPWAVRLNKTVLSPCTVGGVPKQSRFVPLHRGRCALTKRFCIPASLAVRPNKAALFPCTVVGTPKQNGFVPMHCGRCAQTQPLCSHALRDEERKANDPPTGILVVNAMQGHRCADEGGASICQHEGCASYLRRFGGLRRTESAEWVQGSRCVRLAHPTTGKACLAPACLRQVEKSKLFYTIVLADKRHRLMRLSQRCVTSVRLCRWIMRLLRPCAGKTGVSVRQANGPGSLP
jgi:hypothetical protein